MSDTILDNLVQADTMRLIEESQRRYEKSPAELQLDEGRGNYMGAGAADEPTGGGRDE